MGKRKSIMHGNLKKAKVKPIHLTMPEYGLKLFSILNEDENFFDLNVNGKPYLYLPYQFDILDQEKVD